MCLRPGRTPVADDAGGQPDDQRAARQHVAGGRGDRDQAGHGARGDAQDRRLALGDPLDEHPGDGGGRGARCGSRPWPCPRARRPRPAEPALKPNQPTHSSDVPIRVSVRLCGAIGSLPKPIRLPSTRQQTRPAMPALMCTTVPPAKSSTPSPNRKPIGRPDPMGDRRVDQDRPQHHEDQHRRELHPVDEGAHDQRRGDRGEGHLEHHEDRSRG